MEDIFNLGIKALILNEKKEILLLKVNREQLKKYNGEAYWDIPGGRIHKGSTVEETLKREVKEETGLENIISIKPLSMTLSNIRIPQGNSDVGLILSVYVCGVKNTKNIKLSVEHTEYRWVNLKEASKLLKVKYPKEFTDKIPDL